jgi:hypothetical protein
MQHALRPAWSKKKRITAQFDKLQAGKMNRGSTADRHFSIAAFSVYI